MLSNGFFQNRVSRCFELDIWKKIFTIQVDGRAEESDALMLGGNPHPKIGITPEHRKRPLNMREVEK